MQKAADTSRKLPFLVLGSLLLLLSRLTSWILGPAHLRYHLYLPLSGSADFLGLISLLCYMLDPSSEAGLWSLLGSHVLQSSKRNVGKEDHTLDWCWPRLMTVSNTGQEGPPFHSSSFPLHVSQTTRTFWEHFPEKLMRVQGNGKPQEIHRWTGYHGSLGRTSHQSFSKAGWAS